MSDIYKELCDICTAENVKCDEPMKNHTTFKIGGPAKYYVTPENNEQISGVIKYCRDNKIDYYVMGNGSNLLVMDEGYEGVIVSMYNKHSNIFIRDNMIIAEAGAVLNKVGMLAKEHGLTGFEFATGIPGCVGGAVAMNAGAYGGEIKDCIVSCRVLDKTGEIIELSRDELKLGYRESIILEKGFIVLDATFELKDGNVKAIEDEIRRLAIARKDKQPLEFPSAGSTFKRPPGHFAGKLIEDAGLKGYSIGGMAVSEKHSGFIINTGNGTADEFLKLVAYVKETVYEKYNIELELEVKILGNEAKA